ncbi:MAG TPA: hypothetical protein VJH96_04665 [Patescibacteria group bacterium]|nr:hypothetical protein [Patescibacteria group bacterium]
MNSKERPLESLHRILQEITPYDLQDFLLANLAGQLGQIYDNMSLDAVVDSYCPALKTELTRPFPENEKKKREHKHALVMYGLTWLSFDKEVQNDIKAAMHRPKPTEEEKNLGKQFDTFVVHMFQLYEQIKKKSS